MTLQSLSLRAKITLSVLVAISAIAAALIWQASSTLWSQTRDGIYTRAISVSDTAVPSFEFWLASQQTLLESTADVTSLHQVYGSMQQAKKAGGFLDIYFARLDGSLFISGQVGRLKGFDARDSHWYQQALSDNRTITTDPYISDTTQEAMITIATPVRVKGETVAVLGADISLAALQANINSYNVGNKAFAMLLDRSGRFIAHPDSSLIMQPFSHYAPEINQSKIQDSMKEDAIQVFDQQGHQQLVFFSAVPKNDWIFAIQMDRETEESNYVLLLEKLIGIGVVLTLGFIATIAFIINRLLRGFYQVSDALKDIAQGEGDLTKTITVQSNDEVGQLASYFNQFVKNMHTLVSNIVELSSQLHHQAQETAKQAQHRSQRIATQQSEINMVATAVNQMSSATHEIAQNAESTSKESDSAVAISQQGVAEVERSQTSIMTLADNVQDSRSEIEALAKHANDISGILSVIQGIAEQTNLLALNAAIEAARAGEQGRGFAVVADEVRVLSQRTHSSTDEIQQTIETLQNATKSVVESMAASQSNAERSVANAQVASQSLEEIMQSVGRIDEMSTQIATAAEEQSLVTQEITRNTHAINDVSDELAREAHLASQQAQQLSDFSHKLQQEVAQFKL